MKHHIIAKFNALVADKNEICGKAEKLFSLWSEYPFLTGCEIFRNCVDRTNRHDIMIVLSLDRENLPMWDECALHKSWLNDFGKLLETKTIIDCE